MKPIVIASVSLLLLAPLAAHGQHSLGMHSHSGADGASACLPERYTVLIDPYPIAERGTLDHKVSTTSKRAQELFNQGLTFLYGFDSESAIRSFYQASLADPKLAMAHWGAALAAGGDLNISIDDPCRPFAVEQSRMANGLRQLASPDERLYIDALAQRYATHTPVAPNPRLLDFQQLGVYYMHAMRSVHEKLGAKDPDATALYAYSLMGLRPWLWWTLWGKPSDEITTVLTVVDAGLHIFPGHIGLNHMKIHAMEEGPIEQANRALASAELLMREAPFITPHLRHMPAHTFLLLGDWDRVIEANLRAVNADKPWVDKCGNPSSTACNQLLVGHYYSHDMLFLDVGYNNRGEWNQVEPLSDRLETNVGKFITTQPGLEHYLTTKVAMMVHFGKWEQLAALPPPQSDLPDPQSKTFCADLKLKLATAMWYFGRGMAYASLGRPTDEVLFGFQQAQGCVQSAGLGWGNNSAAAILQVVRWRLLERIARAKGLRDASKTFALLAVETEDLLDYDEPPGWYLSSRETYGASLFLAGNYNDAEKVFRADQMRRPNNSRSLFGLWQALEAQHSPEAGAVKQKFDRIWKGSVPPSMKDL